MEATSDDVVEAWNGWQKQRKAIASHGNATATCKALDMMEGRQLHAHPPLWR